MITPTLDALAADPALAASLSPSALSTIYREVARVEAALRALILTAGPQTTLAVANAYSEELLTIGEAAHLLRVSRDTLYRRWRDLPFAFRDGLDGRLKFSRRGVERYVE